MSEQVFNLKKLWYLNTNDTRNLDQSITCFAFKYAKIFLFPSSTPWGSSGNNGFVDEDLKSNWMPWSLRQSEIYACHCSTTIGAELENLSGSNRFGFLADHRGMFSLTWRHLLRASVVL